MNTVYLGQGVRDELILEMIDHSYQRVVDKLPRREKSVLFQTEQNSHVT